MELKKGRTVFKVDWLLVLLLEMTRYRGIRVCLAGSYTKDTCMLSNLWRNRIENVPVCYLFWRMELNPYDDSNLVPNGRKTRSHIFRLLKKH